MARKKGDPHKITLTQKQIDQIRFLSEAQCTVPEIAATIGVNRQMLWNQIHLEKHPDVAAAYYDGREYGKQRIRSKQYAVALAGNTTMLIWLGKNMLDQRDKFEQDVNIDPINKEAMLRAAAQDLVKNHADLLVAALQDSGVNMRLDRQQVEPSEPAVAH